MAAPKSGQVIDIGGSALENKLRTSLQDDFIKNGKKSARVLPTELFYFGPGLDLWNKVCWIKDYHQTRDEIALLEKYSAEICREIPAGCTIVDMGSGEIRKPVCLLQCLEKLKIPVTYYALDLSHKQLEESMSYLQNKYKYVKTYGLWGTFEDGRQWLRTVKTPKLVLSLGSMFGNDEFNLAVERMRPWREVMGPNDLMLLGMDARGSKDELQRMYHDKEGIWEAFIRHGLAQSNRILGAIWYKDEDWVLDGIIDKNPPRHKFVLRAIKGVKCDSLSLKIKKGESAEFFESWKYGPEIMKAQFKAAGMKERGTWKSPLGAFHQYLISFM